jgi:histidinol-phosphate aminotransferase
MSNDIQKLARQNILELVPYACARDEYTGEASVFLDANENSLGSPLRKWYNRYPDPHQQKLKKAIQEIKGIPSENIFLGNGSDECIDLLYRCFCDPGKDNIIICPPTYGMYEVSARINDVQVKKVPLLPSFELDMIHLENAVDDNTKIIWICYPNNPTGNCFNRQDVEMILHNFPGIVVIDEAYINFSRFRSFTASLPEHPRLVVLQTLSKAWGLAGLRLGMAFASVEIISLMNKVKPPYNISQPTQELVIQALEKVTDVNTMIYELTDMRQALSEVFLQMPFVKKVYNSEANFLLVKMEKAKSIYNFLVKKGIVVRDRSKVIHCDDCLRITIGTEAENTRLVDMLSEWHRIQYIDH